MITEDQFEQLAIQWHGLGRNIEHRTLNIERRSEEKRRLTAEREALRTLTPALSQGEKEEDGRLAEVLRTLIPDFSQWEKEKERGGIRRLNPSISEESSATHKDSLSVEIKSK